MLAGAAVVDDQHERRHGALGHDIAQRLCRPHVVHTDYFLRSRFRATAS